MAEKKKGLTEKEKASLIFAVRTGKYKTTEEWRYLYMISRPKTERATTESLYLTNISRWKNQKVVQDFFNEQMRIWEDEKKKIGEDAIKEYLLRRKSKTEGGKEEENFFNGEINFQDRNEFLTFLNSQANKITDDKQRLDYLKLISDLLRLKETDQKGNEEIQRFYTPVKCSECAIYLKAKEESK